MDARPPGRAARLRALIFDMDGTLADTDPVHIRAFVDFLAPFGITVDDEVYRTRITGRTNDRIFADLLPDRSADERRRLSEEKEALFRRMSPDLAPLAGLVDLLDWAEARGLRIALVTNGPRANVVHTLDVLGIAERFAVTVAGEDVARGKPDPLPYRTALERLGLAPDEAIAFEDSPAGLKAAKAADLVTVGVLTGQTAEALTALGADLTVQDFTDAGLKRLLEERA
jgi:beta-phosphoglucomutase